MAGTFAASFFLSRFYSKHVKFGFLKFSVRNVYFFDVIFNIVSLFFSFQSSSSRFSSKQKKMSSNGHYENGNGGPKRGAFIVFEGLDKSGKSSQAKSLVDRLNDDGISAALAKFPCKMHVLSYFEGCSTFVFQLVKVLLELLSTSICEKRSIWRTNLFICCLARIVGKLSKFLHFCVLTFFCIDCICRTKLLDLLIEGVTVIVDRYAYSGIAFSAAKVRHPEAAAAGFFSGQISSLVSPPPPRTILWIT